MDLREVAIADMLERYNIEAIGAFWWNKEKFHQRGTAHNLDVLIDFERTATWDAFYHPEHNRMYLRADVGERYLPSDVAK